MATALTTLFSFLAYTIPSESLERFHKSLPIFISTLSLDGTHSVLGGALADTRWGRFRTIAYGTVIAFVAHIISENKNYYGL